MGLRIYNSLTGQKEDFKPLNPPEVKMYVCGPTVYDEPHIGHLRSAFVFEVMRNWLKHTGYNVTFVRNVTDVDDKIIQKALQEKDFQEKSLSLEETTKKVSEDYFRAYKQDLTALGIDDPAIEPRATAYIQQMIDLIGRLIQKGFAYHTVGSSDVYFEVKKFSNYGKLSKQKIDEMMDQARKESAPGKRDPLDFALWKGAKPDEPMWESPWGPGRPGWHIECSAMNLACLGEQIDIHGGGLDLKFPHHENEIAQSEAATGKPFAQYWIHHGLVTVNGQKMSKSLKNYVTYSSATQEYGAKALKVFFLSAHYPSSADYSSQAMSEAKSQYERFLNFFREAKKLEGQKSVSVESEWQKKFHAAMDDDFNTPKALAVMHELVEATRKSKEPDRYVTAVILLESWGQVLGNLFAGMDQAVLIHDQVAWIEEKLKERKAAKGRRDFAAADTIRKGLIEKNIEIRDLPDGTTEWWVKI